MSDQNIEPGSLLIAPPSMQDPRFDKSVIIVMEHSRRRGTLGLVVNKVMSATLSDITTREATVMMPSIPIYWGGPVNPHGLWMLHSAEWSCDHTWELSDTWAISSSEEILEAFATWTTPEHFRLFVGHCGWAKGQLMRELNAIRGHSRAGSWLIAQEPDPADLFGADDGDELWLESTTWSRQYAVSNWL